MALHTPWRHETDPSAFHFGAPHGYDKISLGPLLAAAPELLAAAQILLAAADEGDADKAMDGYDALRAAVAKAEGR